MLESISKIELQEDPLFQQFRQALTMHDPSKNLIGRCYTGSIEASASGYIGITSADPDSWADAWRIAGFEKPPTELPKGCMFSFNTARKAGYDTELCLVEAHRRASGVNLQWSIRHTPKAGAVEHSAYSLVILPKGSISEHFSYETQ
jgi:hypothetical protein